MKTITTTQFIELLKTATITTHVDSKDIIEYEDGPDMEYGYIRKQLVIDGLRISYQNSYEHPIGKPAQVTTCDDLLDLWIVEQVDFAVIDDDGNKLGTYEMGEIIIKHTSIESFDLDLLDVVAAQTLTFEQGDIAECDYYNVRGTINSIHKSNGITYIELVDAVGNKITTNLIMKVSGRAYPYYLKLICKKSDIKQMTMETLNITNCDKRTI